MKKIFVVIFLTFILFGCQKENSITMIVPYGSPQLAQLYLEDSSDYHVDIVHGPDPLIAAFGSSSHDVIFAPINLGAKLYQSKESYQLLATIVWGNYYLVSNNSDTFDISSLDGKEITVFGKNQTSDIILNYLLDELEVDPILTYVDSVSSAAQIFLSFPDQIALVAEPVYSKIIDQKPQTKTIDVQEIYRSVTGNQSYPQSGVFVRSDLDSETIIKIEEDLKSSIDKANQDLINTAELAVKLEMDLSKEIISQAIINSNLYYVSAQDSKNEIDVYFNLILSRNPLLIGGELPRDTFYYGD